MTTLLKRTQPLAAALAVAIACSVFPRNAQSANDSGGAGQQGLLELSVEELLNVEITSVSKKAQKLADTAAAVYVITNDDIRRSGATTIPEALRLAPGVDVARMSSGRWAITIRGFNSRFANKLLVLVDGRSVYTPLFGGVLWESQDTLLEDVDRIEVIRGPGAAIWGANAVNGVINIITKKAADTQGGLLAGGAGSEQKFFGGARYGFKFGESTHMRISAKAASRDASRFTNGDKARDDERSDWFGFRLDHQIGAGDTFTLQGDSTHARTGDTLDRRVIAPPFELRADIEPTFRDSNALARWQHRISDTSDLELQVYYDLEQIDVPLVVEQTRRTIDLDMQHRFRLGARNDISWGLGYRTSRDDTKNLLNPDRRTLKVISAFAQDDIALIPDKLRATLGVKVEHNDFTGTEFQPNLRLLWNVSESGTAWASVSRAVRTPSRAENDSQVTLEVIPPNPPFSPLPVELSSVGLGALGRGNMDSEKVLAYEAGYRTQWTPRLSTDLAVYYNDYRDLRRAQADPSVPPELVPGPAPFISQRLVTGNNFAAKAYGLELSADWLARDWWRLTTGYAYQHMKVSDRSADIEDIEGLTPSSILTLRSSMDLGQHVQFDAWLRYVSSRTGFTLPRLSVDAYTSLDLRLAWSPRKDLELSLVGQNLLDERHLEFVPDLLNSVPTEIERGVYAKVKWTF
jgi:iron complex outermembrane recepter protein